MKDKCLVCIFNDKNTCPQEIVILSEITHVLISTKNIPMVYAFQAYTVP